MPTDQSLSNKLEELQPGNTILSNIVNVGGALTNPLSIHFETNAGGTIGLNTNEVRYLVGQQMSGQEYIFYDDFERANTTNGWVGASSPSEHVIELMNPDPKAPEIA